MEAVRTVPEFPTRKSMRHAMKAGRRITAICAERGTPVAGSGDYWLDAPWAPVAEQLSAIVTLAAGVVQELQA